MTSDSVDPRLSKTPSCQSTSCYVVLVQLRLDLRLPSKT